MTRTTNGSDLYRTVEIEEQNHVKIITYNDHMKETVFRYKDGTEEVTYDMINVHELDRLNAMYDIANEPEPQYTVTDVPGHLEPYIELSDTEKAYVAEKQKEMENLGQIREQSHDHEPDIER
jgi:hypothetical protein